MGHPCFLCVFLLALSLESVSGHPEDTLRTTEDLRDKDFGHNYPRHGLNLLYWFSREYIKFDNNSDMQPHKDPSQGDFGFYNYENYDGLLPSLPLGYNYYAVGNLGGGSYRMLPNYVHEEFRSSQGSAQNNRDRIIIRVTSEGNIDQVYITQKHDVNRYHRKVYDPDNTYAISEELIKTIRGFSYEQFIDRFPPRGHNHYHPYRPERVSECCGVLQNSEGCNVNESGRLSVSMFVCLSCAVIVLLISCPAGV